MGEREGGRIMRNKAIAGLVVLSFLMVLSGLTGCAKNAYFGVRSKAIGVPEDFEQTEAAIEKAEKSPGAKYAPEKIAKARELGKKGVETYWGCRTAEAMAMLDEARRLAGEAELAKAPPKPAPAPVAVAPPPPKPAPAKKAPTPAPPKPKAVAVPPAPKKIIILKGTNFAFDSAELTPEGQAILSEQAKILHKEATIRVEIAGHADSTGPEAYNQRLSEKRAKVVEAFLIGKGVSADSLKVVGYGKSRPVATNDTKEGRAQNRRVELIVKEK
jgi:outer membrane protein OmpA-like peptidoglycan-associated protein